MSATVFDSRESTFRVLSRLLRIADGELEDFLASHFADDVVFDVAHPVNRLQGLDSVRTCFYEPLRAAFDHVHRRDAIFIGGENQVAAGQWAASVTHYVGNFRSAIFGIEPNSKLVFLRAGEFYRIVEGRIAEAKILIDFLDLLRQVGRFPLPRMLGTEMLFPSPATHDGVLPENHAAGEASYKLVSSMLADLTEYDSTTFGSPNQTGEDGYWHDDMLWYGPAGIGSNYRWEGFATDHRAPFLNAFPDRRGGNHFCRFGDANYAAISGWPSMTMTHTGDYLGMRATNKKLTLRVMDFYRCEHDKIAENWVLLDYLDLFQQMGVDLIEQARMAECRT